MQNYIKNRDLTIGIVLLVFSVWVYFTAQKIPVGKISGMPPTFFPSFLAIVLGLLSIMLITKAIKEVVAGAEQEYEKQDLKRVLLIILALSLYIVLFKHIGFILLTILYLTAMMLLLNAGRLIKIIPISIIITFSVYYIFGTLFRVPLP
jgi:putative tricarboxylic transport membrane protein